MNRIILLFLPVVLFASETDVVPRTINFIIFIALMYYLTAKHFKNIYLSRVEAISSRLKTVEQGLAIAKKNKEDAIEKIEKANKNADELIKLAHEEAKKIEENIAKETENEIENMKKSYEEQKIFEERQAKLEVVNELLEEIFNEKLHLSQEDLLNIISKKVA